MAAQNRNCKVKRLALMGLLFALAMALSFLESLLPALPMLPPGIRLGLSNIVTMYALFALGPVSGYTIAVLKSLFVLLTRGAVAAAMSASGGIASVTVMLLLSLLPAQGISLAPGQLFSADQRFAHCIRLNFAAAPAHDITRATHVLGGLVRGMDAGSQKGG